MPLLREFAPEFLAFSARTLTPGALDQYESCLRLHIIPLLGDVSLEALNSGHAYQLQASLLAHPSRSNKAVMVLCRMTKVACLLGRRTSRIEKPRSLREDPKVRFLSNEECERLMKVVRADRTMGARVVELALLTGCRRGELLKLRWSEVDFGRRVLNLSRTKTGASIRPIADGAALVLASLPRASEWVFPGATGHQTTVQKTWERLRRAAGVEDVRFHDLRHSFASRAAEAGVPLLTIGKLLGHRTASQTARYAHLAPGTLLEAAERATRGL